MTHAFFKALVFLGSGSVIHAMAGEQDMRRMGGLQKYMPYTFATMMIGTLAIAGIFPLSGFFSKDEILFQSFLHNKAIWVLAVVTAFMTAFYMFRLMSMTFFGAYRGPSWQAAAPVGPVDRAKDIRVAARHGAPHPADVHAHGRAHEEDHEVAHGPAEPHDPHAAHGHGAWHGPHESPGAMTGPLFVLAVGAMVAGFVGVPAALWGGNAIEHFLEPSFTATTVAGSSAADAGLKPRATGEDAALPGSAGEEAEAEPHASRGLELSLMAFSFLIAVGGIALAYKFYVTSPEIPERLATTWPTAHRTLLNKYYVDEM
jgi:NADH-quinone oxidoreductase subunit L